MQAVITQLGHARTTLTRRTYLDNRLSLLPQVVTCQAVSTQLVHARERTDPQNLLDVLAK